MNSNGLTLGDLCEAIVDCEHKTAPLEESGIPSIRTSDIRGGVIDFRGANKVSESTYKEWTKRREPREGDLIFCREAPVGEVGRLRAGEQAALGQRTVLLCPDRDKIDPRYLHYLLLGHELQFLMDGWSTGSTVAHLNVKDIRKLPIPYLHKSGDQEFIGGLFDRIDVLRREISNISRLLEDALSAIFRSWFIDFDPVKAKAEGKLPFGMDDETAALFPDSFEDSEFGRIPSGWKVGKLSDIAKITMGTSPPGDTYCELDSGILPLLNGAGDFNSSVLAPKQGTTQPTKIANEGDFVFCIRATIGNLSVCEEKYCIGRGVASAREKNWFDRGFLYHAISNLFRVWEWEATGSVIKGVTGPEVKNSPMVLPPESIRKSFENSVLESMLIIQNCMNLEDSLSKYRDSLLPRLMSGEIGV